MVTGERREDQTTEQQMSEHPSPVHEVEVFCICGHAAIIFHAQDAAPRIRCSKCGAAGPITDFLTPRGEQAPDRMITLVPVDRSMA
jgi:hypothetical protein